MATALLISLVLFAHMHFPISDLFFFKCYYSDSVTYSRLLHFNSGAVAIVVVVVDILSSLVETVFSSQLIFIIGRIC